MEQSDSVARWCQQLREGNEAGAQLLWNHCFERLVRLAKKKLGQLPRPVRDEEDIALSAFKSLCHGIQRGLFSELASRESLWRLLLVITTRKVQDQLTHDRRLKRGGLDGGHFSLNTLTEQHEPPSPEPPPELIVQMTEAVQQLFEQLEQDELKRIALRKLEGFTSAEIATEFNRSLATIERKLKTIRTIWQEQMP